MTLEVEFDFSVDLTQALLWRYNNAARLTSIIEAKQAWYDLNQNQFWQNWFDNVFNLQTANDFGCAVWAIILDLPLNIGTPPVMDTMPFGFGNFNSNFGNSNFSPVERNTTFLTTAQTILLLRLRYFQLTSRGNVFATNVVLATLFGPDNVYLIDNLNMTLTCMYRSSALPATLLTVIQQYDVIPRPACVVLTYTAF